jgi:serine/threonine protein kinase
LGGYHKDALPVGHHLADYVIESVLGFGGFGVTYLARDNKLGAEVAIKEYLPQDISGRIEQTRVLPNPDAPNGIRDYQWGLKEFLREARNLVQFKHPNIVRVLRFMEANGTAYMVMEYEQGESLSHYLKHKPGRRLDEKELLRIFLPVLNGLGEVHKAGMLHLDIKPDNIYLRTDHTPMLIDFGSARQAISGGEHAQRITLTHGFAPIEQYPDKGKPGPWTDLYAIGASMYYCICARRPEVSINRYQTMLRHQADPVTPAIKAGEGRYSRYLLECIDWALQIYPKDRPQSVQELQDGLMGKGSPKSGTVQIQITMPDKGPARPSRIARMLRWLLVILAAAALGGGGLYAYKPVLAKQLWVKSQRLAKHYSQQLSRLMHSKR